MKKRIVWLLLLCMIFPLHTLGALPAWHLSTVASASSSITHDEDKNAEINRYRSGRRSYRPSPGFNAPARPVSPRYQAPRRTGLFGGIGSFFAGAFLGSMLFSPFLGGYGHFSLFGLLLDILVLFFIFRLARTLFRRGQRH